MTAPEKERTISTMSNLQVTQNAVVLEAVKIYAQTRISPVVQATMKLEQAADVIAGDLIYMLHGYLYGKIEASEPELHSRTLQVDYPATWWQALKLAAIKAGNPFIDPAKIRYQRTVRTATVIVASGHTVACWCDWGEPTVVHFAPTLDWSWRDESPPPKRRHPSANGRSSTRPGKNRRG